MVAVVVAVVVVVVVVVVHVISFGRILTTKIASTNFNFFSSFQHQVNVLKTAFEWI